MNTKLQERKKLNLVYANRIGKMEGMYKGKSIECRTEKLALCFDLIYIFSLKDAYFIQLCIIHFYYKFINIFTLSTTSIYDHRHENT